MNKRDEYIQSQDEKILSVLIYEHKVKKMESYFQLQHTKLLQDHANDLKRITTAIDYLR